LHRRDEFDVLRAAQRLDLLQQGRHRNAQPGNHHAPAFDAAQAVDALFQRCQFQDVFDAERLRLSDQAFDADGPRPCRHAVRVARRVALVGAEFVEIAVARRLPDDFLADWLSVAADEARHFGLLSAHLQALGYAYGDFPAHAGLWDMARRTAGDALTRMALVPRVLEARGLDATPPIAAKLRAIGDVEALAILDIVLNDEITHVAIGDRWFRHLCGEAGLDSERTFLELFETFGAPRLQPPVNVAARIAAGFSEAELTQLTALRARQT
jgi:hypothetical protein